ncbi:MAG: signal peptidase I [Solobacterium sp.]|nr:signal peptidase I [Solobacterium sp.]
MEKEQQHIEDPILTEDAILAHRKTQEEKRYKEQKKAFLNELFDFVKTFLISAAIVFVTVHYIATPVQVKGNSMYPTLKNDSLGFSNVLGRRIEPLKRFDIVVIYFEDRNDYLVKRLIGLPGETIAYHDEKLYINGQEVEETFLDQMYMATFSSQFTEDIEEITLGEDEVYCLGDNRPTSRDSRYYGPFKVSQITSKGVFVVYPFKDFGVKSW